MTLEEVIAAPRAEPTQSVPFTGRVLGRLQRGASYTAGKNGTLGVPVFWSGGKLRTASLDIARRLGVEDAVAPAKNEQQAKTTAPLAAATPVIQSAAPKLASARSRKPPAPKAVSARKAPARKAAASRQSQSEAVG